jgi:hypothetical protein
MPSEVMTGLNASLVGRPDWKTESRATCAAVLVGYSSPGRSKANYRSSLKFCAQAPAKWFDTTCFSQRFAAYGTLNRLVHRIRSDFFVC